MDVTSLGIKKASAGRFNQKNKVWSNGGHEEAARRKSSMTSTA